MKKYYDEKKYNLAFERCVNIMSSLMQKNGRKVLTDAAIESILKMTEKQIQNKPEDKIVVDRLQSYLDRCRLISRKE